MNWKTFEHAALSLALAGAGTSFGALLQPQVLGYGKGTFVVGAPLSSVDFSQSENWIVQVEAKGISGAERVEFGEDMMELYMPGRGCTAWLNHKFEGPIAIVYQVRCPTETVDYPDIQVRDINNFWHCSDVDVAEEIFDSAQYTGSFSTYNKMLGWYASTGGGGATGNLTTRFRRYPREVDGSAYPHIALNDRDGMEEYLITPGKWHTVQLVAYNDIAQYIVDGKVVYEIREGDPVAIETPSGIETRSYSLEEFPPHTEGYFGFRLLKSHHQYKNLSIYRLNPVVQAENSSAMSGASILPKADPCDGEYVEFSAAGNEISFDLDEGCLGSSIFGFRVASGTDAIQFDFLQGSNLLASVNRIATGGDGIWTTIYREIAMGEGQPRVTVRAAGGRWNMDWIECATSFSSTNPLFNVSEAVIALEVGPESLSLSWPGTPDSRYTLQSSTNLVTDNFSTLLESGIPSVALTNSVTVEHPGRTAFYRVIEE